MSKDPAFLFYSKDFYEGTRMMIPEERACYMDLLVYQHQNGLIPKDLRRVLMYCSGIDEATLKATLKAKFKQTESGEWVNEKLLLVCDNRKEYSRKQSESGKIGQFFKKAKAILKHDEFLKLKDSVYSVFGKENLIELIKIENTLEGSLKALLKHLENVNGIVIVNANKDNKKGSRDFQAPTIEEFIEYAILKKPDVDLESVKLKFESWKENNWKTGGGKSRKIKNWKSTLLNTLPHLKEKNSTKKESKESAATLLHKKYGVNQN